MSNFVCCDPETAETEQGDTAVVEERSEDIMSLGSACHDPCSLEANCTSDEEEETV